MPFVLCSGGSSEDIGNLANYGVDSSFYAILETSFFVYEEVKPTCTGKISSQLALTHGVTPILRTLSKRTMGGQLRWTVHPKAET